MTTSDRRDFLKTLSLITASLAMPSCTAHSKPETLSSTKLRPNIILVMTDDQGWGQTGYYQHPVLKTPNLDEMASNGLRLDRFYAAAPVCSPTRASVLTGRANNRTGVPTHGHALRREEKTLPQALAAAGYATGHFGKWHLSGLRGPGVPMLAGDPHSPGVFGFQEWLTVTNYFDMNPLMSRNGEFEQFRGDTSNIIVTEALKFISQSKQNKQPFLTVIWDAAPHSPWQASKADRQAFQHLDPKSQHHYGELVAFDRSLGHLRKGLRDLSIANNTLVWYCSDNGGLNDIQPSTVGGLRGYKGTIWEGGLRVPCIIEWPGIIQPRITQYPASTMDIFPTIANLLQLPESALLPKVDGQSLHPLLKAEIGKRDTPIPFRFVGKGALIDNDYKLVARNIKKGVFELYNIKSDPAESLNLASKHPHRFKQMRTSFLQWNRSVNQSASGQDYPNKNQLSQQTQPHSWVHDPQYQKYIGNWEKRPEYNRYIKRQISLKKNKNGNTSP